LHGLVMSPRDPQALRQASELAPSRVLPCSRSGPLPPQCAPEITTPMSWVTNAQLCFLADILFWQLLQPGPRQLRTPPESHRIAEFRRQTALHQLHRLFISPTHLGLQLCATNWLRTYLASTHPAKRRSNFVETTIYWRTPGTPDLFQRRRRSRMLKGQAMFLLRASCRR